MMYRVRGVFRVMGVNRARGVVRVRNGSAFGRILKSLRAVQINRKPRHCKKTAIDPSDGVPMGSVGEA